MFVVLVNLLPFVPARLASSCYQPRSQANRGLEALTSLEWLLATCIKLVKGLSGFDATELSETSALNSINPDNLLSEFAVDILLNSSFGKLQMSAKSYMT